MRLTTSITGIGPVPISCTPPVKLSVPMSNSASMARSPCSRTSTKVRCGVRSDIACLRLAALS
jgi:hypothetical protein